VKYTNYQQFGSKTKITFEGKEVEKKTTNSPDKPASQDKPQK